MYHYCKLCGECLILDRSYEKFTNSPLWQYKCRLCPEYFLLIEGSEIIWNCLVYKNISFYVFSDFCIDNIDHGKAVLRIYDGSSTNDLFKFPLKELTHELAVQWVNKLKTFVVFQ